MKPIFCCLLVALILPITVVAQEICDNGIDDDADGLVDLNDTTNCPCDVTLDTFNLINNPSFEEYDGTCPSAYPTGIPSSFGLADCIADWVNPTRSSPDAYNLLGFNGNMGIGGVIAPMPVPDGTGYFGMVSQLGNSGPDDFFHEYLGTCLKNGGIEAGTEYQFSFQMAAREQVPGTAYIENNEVTVWGARSCGDVRITGIQKGCAERIGNDWVRIASVTAPTANASNWTAVSVDFTTSEDFAAIIVGVDCQEGLVLPPGRIASEVYYFFDEMRLAPTTSPPPPFGSISTASAGGCAPVVGLSITPLPLATYQWYANGTALVGETATTLTTTAIFDTFTVRAILPDGSCTLAAPIVPGAFVLDSMRAVETIQICDGMPPDRLSLNGLSTNISDIVWSTGETTPTIFPDTVGTYSVTYQDSCFFIERIFEMIPAVRPAFPIIVEPAVFCPGDTVVITIEASDSFSQVTLIRTIDGTPTIFMAEESDTIIAPADGLLRYQIGFGFSSCLPGGLEDLVIGSGTPEFDFLLDDPDCPDEMGSITPILTSAATENYDYVWATLAGAPIAGDSLLTDVPAGSYVFTVAGTCGPLLTDTLTLTESGSPSLSLDESGASGCDSGTVIASASPAGPDYSYAWTDVTGNIVGTDSIFTSDTSGRFEVVLTYGGGCTTPPLPVNVTVTDLAIVSAVVMDEGCAATGTGGRIESVVVSGVSSAATLVWFSEAGDSIGAGASLIGLEVGNYRVVVTDGSCSVDSVFTVSGSLGDCDCVVVTDTANLILNPSFENYDAGCVNAYPSGLPSGLGAAGCVSDWFNPVSSGSPDAFNLLGYNGEDGNAAATPLPGGMGYFGLLNLFSSFDGSYHEYLATCLRGDGIVAGEDYQFSFSISIPTPADAQSYSPVNEVAIWGVSTCGEVIIPSIAADCVEDLSSTWVLLGTTSVPTATPTGWTPAIIDFTADADYAAIAIGIPCQGDIPLAPGQFVAESYYFFDEVRLALTTETRAVFGPIRVSSDGGCDPVLELFVDTPPAATLQWYANGSPLAGEVFPVLTTTALSDTFFVRAILDDGSCLETSPFVAGTFFPDTMRASTVLAVCDSVPPDRLSLADLSPGASSILWSTGETTPTIFPDTISNYTVTYQDGCFFVKRTFELEPIKRPAFPIAVEPANFCPGDTIIVTVAANDSFSTFRLIREIAGSPVTFEAVTSDTIIVPPEGFIRYQISFDFASCLPGGLEDFVVGSSLPNFDFLVNPPNCPGETGGITPVLTSAATQNYDYAWATPAGAPIATDSILTDVPAADYVLTVSGTCGPLFTDTLTLMESVAPSVMLDESAATGCNSGTVIASASPASTDYSYAWTDVDGNLVGTDSTFTSDTSGRFEVVLTYGGGCTTPPFPVNVTVTDLAIVSALVTNDDCAGAGARGRVENVVVSGASSAVDFAWFNSAGDLISTANALSNLPAGNYLLVISDGDCTVDSLFTVGRSGILEGLSLQIDRPVTCSNNGRIRLSGSAPDYATSWLDAAGVEIARDSTALSVTSGSYVVAVTNPAGCTDTLEVTLSDPVNPTFTVSPGAVTDTCLTSPAAAAASRQLITFSASGGTPPYTFSVNGNAYATDPERLLPVGATYTYAVRDAASCTGEPIVGSLPVPNFLALSVSSDLALAEGSGTTLSSELTGAITSEPVISWSPPGSLSCSDCPNPIARPDSTTTYVVTYAIGAGCELLDSVTISVAPVIQPRTIYLPTAFSPNGDGRNDTFRAFAEDEEEAIVNSLAIYDRWGGLLYAFEGPTTFTDFAGWDGRGRDGEQLLSGVYVFVLQVGFTDGIAETLSGEVTLVR